MKLFIIRKEAAVYSACNMKKKIFLMLLCAAVSTSVCACEKTNSGKSHESDAEEISDKTEESVLDDINDFTASLDYVKKTDVKSETTLTFNEKGDAYYIKTNHPDDIYEINFYKIAEEFAKKNDFGMKSRDYLSTYYNYYPMDQACIIYSIPKEIPDLVISFMMKNQQIFEYYVSNNGDNASLVKIDSVSAGDFVQYQNKEDVTTPGALSSVQQ